MALALCALLKGGAPGGPGVLTAALVSRGEHLEAALAVQRGLEMLWTSQCARRGGTPSRAASAQGSGEQQGSCCQCNGRPRRRHEVVLHCHCPTGGWRGGQSAARERTGLVRLACYAQAEVRLPQEPSSRGPGCALVGGGAQGPGGLPRTLRRARHCRDRCGRMACRCPMVSAVTLAQVSRVRVERNDSRRRTQP